MKKPARAGRRLLVAAHSHPAISHGGGELAALRLHDSVGTARGWQSWFLAGARDGSNRTPSQFSQPFDDRQFIFDAAGFDWFKFANTDPAFPRAFTGMLAEIAPDILHFHHYIVLGVEAFLHARRQCPDARIILTLHEFLAICHNHGQMVTHPKSMLCHQSSPRDCNRCYPEHSRADFFLRKLYVTRFFDLVDHFIAPSRMLADRYIAWGLPAERFTVIENVTLPAVPGPTPPADPAILRLGYFGQISELKGIGVVLDAAALLLEEGETAVQFDIHGDYSGQPEHFRAKVVARLDNTGANVRFHGPYDNTRVDALMRGVDAVLVPSVWWENSPIVIQESLRNRRPVICSDIGGMAEKVRNGIDGIHFPAGNPVALAALLRTLARDRTRLDALRTTLRPPDPPETTAKQHISLYERVLADPPRQ